MRVRERSRIAASVRDSAGGTLAGAVVGWVSSDGDVATVDASGTVAAVALGTATITATSGGVSAVAAVTVYEPRLARIDVVPGATSLLTEHHALMTAITYDQADVFFPRAVTWMTSDSTVATIDATGRLTGVGPGTADIMAAADSVTQVVRVTVLLGPPSPNIAGDWTMTLSASPSCRDGLPAIARDRQYTVHFTQHGADFALNISSPTLVVANDGENGGSLIGTAIAFSFIGDTNYYNYFTTTDLHDMLGDGRTLDFEGFVSGVVADSVIHATMTGDLEIGPISINGPLAICRATDHSITLRR